MSPHVGVTALAQSNPASSVTVPPWQASRTDLPIIDGVGCVVGQAEYLVRLGLSHRTPRANARRRGL